MSLRVQPAPTCSKLSNPPKAFLSSTYAVSESTGVYAALCPTAEVEQDLRSYVNAQVKAVLAASLVPNVASMGESSPPTSPPIWLSPVSRGGFAGSAGSGAGAGGGGQLEEVFVHPSSVCYNVNTNQMSQPFVVYLEKVRELCGYGVRLVWAVDCSTYLFAATAGVPQVCVGCVWVRG